MYDNVAWDGVTPSRIQRCCSGVRAWNSSLLKFKKLRGDATQTRVLVTFSDFRNKAELREIYPDGPITDASRLPWFDAIPGRKIFPDGNGRAALTKLQNGKDPVISAAAEHLERLIDGVAPGSDDN